MTQQQTLATQTATEAVDENLETQAPAAKTYSQEEVDNMMARMRGSLEKKLLKPYADLGDPDELRNIKSDYEQRQQAEQIKRGEFERTLQELAAKKDAEIQKRDGIIKEYKVNTPLLSAAAKYRAVAPEQVRALLQNNVRLNADGDVEVIDEKGSVRYNDSGEPVGVEDFVKSWLDSNPHFVAPTLSSTMTQSSHARAVSNGVDIANLDMRKASDRKKFLEAKTQGKK
jgi:hypothetical protein